MDFQISIYECLNRSREWKLNCIYKYITGRRVGCLSVDLCMYLLCDCMCKLPRSVVSMTNEDMCSIITYVLFIGMSGFGTWLTLYIS